MYAGALKMTDMKMTDHRNVQAWNWRTWNWRTWNWRTLSRHEIDGHENDGHENAGHVSGVWIGLHGMDFDLAVLPSNRLLLRFQECSRSKSKLKTIRLYSDDHCVFHRRRACSMRTLRFLRCLCRQTRQYGQRLPDMSHWHPDGYACV